jgi:hypothetical protein
MKYRVYFIVLALSLGVFFATLWLRRHLEDARDFDGELTALAMLAWIVAGWAFVQMLKKIKTRLDQWR